MTALGLGCVKTRRHSIAIEEVIRLRPFHASNSHVAFRFISFLHSQGHLQTFAGSIGMSGLPSEADIEAVFRHVSFGPEGAITGFGLI
jgi:hypothetical protein